MKARILSGKDKNDNDFKAYSYRPFAMPAGATTKGALKLLGANKQYFETKTGATWVVIKGGYLALKKARSPEWDGTVNLTVTGAMLRSMAVMQRGVNMFKIGFTRSEEAQKMIWQIVKGRDGFGISPKDLESLKPLLSENLEIKP